MKRPKTTRLTKTGQPAMGTIIEVQDGTDDALWHKAWVVVKIDAFAGGVPELFVDLEFEDGGRTGPMLWGSFVWRSVRG